MKRYILALVLTLGFIPQHVQAVTPIETTEPGTQIQISAQIQPLKETALPVQPLSYAPFHFDPIGTHPNDYPNGQCTHGAASMKGNVPDWGNANQWADAARAAGYTVSDVPIVGAIAQTNRGTYGHVAVVIAVYPDQSVDITEENFDFNGGIRTRHAEPGEFIYIWM